MSYIYGIISIEEYVQNTTKKKKEKGNPGHCSNILLYTTRSYRRKKKKKTLRTLITKNTNKIIFCTECILQSSTLPHIPHFILRHHPKKHRKRKKLNRDFGNTLRAL
ncbi:unnamed protein product [Ixodes persulcatus]